MTDIDRTDCPPPDPNPRTPTRSLPAGACDAHCHIFGPLGRYPYAEPRSYTPGEASETDYRNLLKTLGFERSVLVQPSVYGFDNSRILDLLRQYHRFDDIGWRAVLVIDKPLGDAQVREYTALGARGVRANMLFDGGVGLDALGELSTWLAEIGWHLQCMIDVSDGDILQRVLEVCHCDLVIDHMGHVNASKALGDPGFSHMLEALREERLWVKCSGAYRITGHDHIPYADVDPIAGSLIRANADRLVFGTDWPHPAFGKPMPNDGDLMEEFFRWTAGDEGMIGKILVSNPASLYGF